MVSKKVLDTYMAMVSQIDDEGSRDGLDGDPGAAVVLGGLEAPDLVLEEERYGAGVGVALEAESEVRLRAFGVEIDNNFLVHVHAGIG